MDKYYTPELDEFYPGFEFEVYIAGSNTEYKKIVIDQYYINFISEVYIKNLQLGWVRVKYLDKEDIESLGWTNFRETHKWFENQPITYYADKDNMMLGVDFENHIICITVKDPTKSLDGKREEYDYPPKVGMFRGYIKNKSELKKLMKQLNIQYDNK